MREYTNVSTSILGRIRIHTEGTSLAHGSSVVRPCLVDISIGTSCALLGHVSAIQNTISASHIGLIDHSIDASDIKLIDLREVVACLRHICVSVKVSRQRLRDSRLSPTQGLCYSGSGNPVACSLTNSSAVATAGLHHGSVDVSATIVGLRNVCSAVISILRDIRLTLLCERHPRRKDEGERKGGRDLSKVSHGSRKISFRKTNLGARPEDPADRPDSSLTQLRGGPFSQLRTQVTSTLRFWKNKSDKKRP